MQPQIGVDTVRKEAWQKVTGAAKYTADYIEPNILHAKLLTSTYASAMILNIDYAQALTMPGVKAILTGNDVPFLTGPILEDMPPLAKDKVRYFGEPVALVVADTEQNAKAAIQKIEVLYSPLPVINTISQAIHPNAPLIHE